uniref:Uncharacterized protein n=1 Tax=Arundo donax TaxID=35708 RepID=A0A0A9FYL7_ARUDO
MGRRRSHEVSAARATWGGGARSMQRPRTLVGAAAHTLDGVAAVGGSGGALGIRRRAVRWGGWLRWPRAWNGWG